MDYITLIILFAPKIFWSFIFFLGVFRYFFRNHQLAERRFFKIITYKLLIYLAVGFRVGYAVFLTVVQYLVWLKQPLTKLLLNSPVDQSVPIPFLFRHSGYFAFYAFGRFWLNVLIAVGLAFAFYLFLKALKKRQERFFEEGEVELGFLVALIAGWPNFVIFLPLVFVSVVLTSIFRLIFFKEAYTTLGWPFILAIFLILVWGNKLITIFHLGVLRI